MITDNDAPVLHDVDTSGGNGGGARTAAAA